MKTEELFTKELVQGIEQINTKYAPLFNSVTKKRGKLLKAHRKETLNFVEFTLAKYGYMK